MPTTRCDHSGTQRALAAVNSYGVARPKCGVHTVARGAYRRSIQTVCAQRMHLDAPHCGLCPTDPVCPHCGHADHSRTWLPQRAFGGAVQDTIPLSVVLGENGRLEKPEFLGLWKSIADTNEQAMPWPVWVCSLAHLLLPELRCSSLGC